MKKIIVGEYDRYGYRIWDANSGREYYRAGNHKQDSYQTATIGWPEVLSLRAIRGECIRVTREIVEEFRAVYGGVERAEEM